MTEAVDRRALLREMLKRKGITSGRSSMPRVDRSKPVKLSLAQQRLWFLEKLVPDTATYNVLSAMRLTGNLNVAALEESFRRVIARHEPLRTSFSTAGEEPVPTIHPEVDFAIARRDVPPLSSQESHARAVALLEEEGSTPFDLGKAPLIRATLIETGPLDHYLGIAMHHIVSDGWSMGVFIDELSRWYTGITSGGDAGLAALEVEFADFAQWQRDWLERGELNRQLEFWRARLQGAPSVLSLPTDRPRPRIQSFKGATHHFEVDSGLTKSLEDLARKHSATLFSVLFAGFSSVVHRYTGQSDIVIGSPFAGRSRVETEPLIGFFVNTLPLRIRLDDGATFADVVRRAAELTVEALQNQDVPFERLVEELRPQRDLGHTPIFQVTFAFQNAPLPSLRLGDVQVEYLPIDTGISKFDLSVDFEPGDGGLWGSINYSTELFDAQTIQRMSTHLVTLLSSAAAAPESTVFDLEVMDTTERNLVTEEWNRTATDYPRDASIPQLFAEVVRKHRRKPAVIWGDRKVTYEELHRSSSALAGALAEHIEPGESVGILLERSHEMVVAMLAVLKAGGCYLPLDLDYPRQRIALMLKDAAVRTVITEVGTEQLVEGERVTTLRVDAAGDKVPKSRAPGAEDAAYVMYTSGSTGRPKGIVIPHRAILRLVKDTNYVEFTPKTVVAQASNASFDAATFEIWGALLNGSTLVGVGRESVLLPDELQKTISTYGINLMFLTTALFHQLASEKPTCFAGLESLYVGGEAGDPDKFARVAQTDNAPRLINAYGPTESTTFASYLEFGLGHVRAGYLPIGRPISNTTCYVLDRALQPVPIGVPGELCLGGDGLATEYVNRPDLTAERFVSTEFGRLYRTGDLARFRSDGIIEYLGRIDDQVKVRGFRIEPGEIESALSEHPGVDDAVVAVKDRGEDRLLVGYYVASAGELPASQLREHLAERLPKFMVPNHFVPIPRIPITANGKVDRAALPDPRGEEAQAGELVPPAPGIEDGVARIFESLLKVEQVGAEGDFFHLGGHSLLATRLVSHIARDFGVEIPLTCVFEDATVRAIAREVAKAESEGRAVKGGTIVPTKRTSDVIEASFAQQRLWFFDQFEPGGSVYNVPMILRMRGMLNLKALRMAVEEETRRHEILRTTFEARAGKPVQVISQDMPVSLKVVDLSHLDEAEREAAAQAAAEEEALRPFDLGGGPLLRTTVIRLTEDDQIVVFATHHIVSDGWSLGILVGELAALYEAFRNDLGSPLPELDLQHADYSEWQRAWFEGPQLEELLSYWKQKLNGAPEVLELPGDRPRPAVQTFDGASIGFTLPEAIGFRLSEFCAERGVTLFMALLAAYKVFLFRYSGQTDVVVGTPIAGRTRSEMEGMIGFFVNTIVLRTDLSGNPTFSEVVARVRESSLGAFEHQDLPFEKLVEEMKPARDLAHSPLFQMVFSLQNVFAPPKEFGDLRVELGDAEMGSAKFDLTLDFMETDSGVEGTLNYNVNIFEQETADRMVRHFLNLLQNAIDSPDAPIGRIPLMDDEEMQEVLSLSRPRSKTGPTSTITERFALQASKRAKAVAVSADDGSVTYEDLDRRSTELAMRLVHEGVRRGEFVPILAGRNALTPVAMLAVLKAGAAYVPVDPSYPAGRIQFVIDDVKAGVIVDAGDESMKFSTQAKVIHASGDSTDQAAKLPDVSPNDPAYVIYTSGSTGRPKGVIVTHRNVSRLFDSTESLFDFNADDVWSVFHSFAFDFSVWELWGALLYGGRAAIVPSEVAKAPGEFLDFLARQKVTVLSQTPSAFAKLSEVDARTDEARDLSLRWAIFGGEALNTFSLGPWIRRRGDQSPRLVNMYGITETTVHVTHRVLTEADTKLETSPIGRGIDDLGVYVVDKQGNLCPLGVPGEIQVGGPGVTLGYLNRSALTAERFMPDDFGDAGARRYLSGDLGRLTRSGLEYRGRADEQIKIRGFRIEPGEVTAALSRVSGVERAAVSLRRDDEGTDRLVAYLTSSGEPPTVTQLRAGLSASLPDYMIPHVFVFVDEIPLTANGKVDFAALPDPSSSRPDLAGEYSAPRTETERKLAEIWQRALKVDRVGIYDNFFDLGGDSFSALEVVHMTNEAGIPMSLRLLFQAQVIADLSIYSEPAVEVDAEQGPVSGSAPLSPQQAWYFSREWADPHHFNNQMLLEVNGDRLEPEALRQTLKLLLEHHDQLRARFEDSGGWHQWISESADYDPLEVVDLGSVDDAVREDAMWARAAEMHASFDLEKGRLFRAMLFNSEKDQRLLLIAHQLVVDAVSWGLLLEDLDDVYSQVASTGNAEFPPKTTSFREWANRVSDYGRSKRASIQEPLWRDLIPGKVTRVPTDHPHGPNLYSSETTHVLSIPSELSKALLADVPARFSVGPSEVLLAGFAGGFQQWSGSSGVLVDLEGHGREDIFDGVDLSGTVGWFSPTFPIYVEADPAEWEKTIRSIVDTVTTLPDGGVGYSVLKYMKESGAPLADMPGAEIFFSFVGSLDPAGSESRFKPLPTTSGTPISPRNRREYVLEVNAATTGEGLQMFLTYGDDVISASSIESLAESTLNALRSIAG